MTVDRTSAKKPVTGLRSVGTFLRRGMCSETMFSIINKAYGHPLRDEEKATQPLVGGILQHGYQCGMVWGAALGAGAEAARRFGDGCDGIARAIHASRRATEAFWAIHETIDCYDITGMHANTSAWQMTKYFFFQGGTVKCFGMVSKAAHVAYRELETAFDETPFAAPASCETCAGSVARRLGLSETHATMVAGLSGGIGLSGGGCGALGAAIWAGELKRVQGGGKVNYRSPEAVALMERFLEASDYQFACQKIVGRRFEGIEDHDQWLAEGGCAEILDALTVAARGGA